MTVLGLLVLKPWNGFPSPFLLKMLLATAENTLFSLHYSCEIPSNKTVPSSWETYYYLQLVTGAVISGGKLKQLIAGNTHCCYDPGARHNREMQMIMTSICVSTGVWSHIKCKKTCNAYASSLLFYCQCDNRARENESGNCCLTNVFIENLNVLG